MGTTSGEAPPPQLRQRFRDGRKHLPGAVFTPSKGITFSVEGVKEKRLEILLSANSTASHTVQESCSPGPPYHYGLLHALLC